MSAEHDRKFFDTFMLVLGILIGIAILLYVLARIIASDTQEKHVITDPVNQAVVAERIAPVAKVGGRGPGQLGAGAGSGGGRGAGQGTGRRGSVQHGLHGLPRCRCRRRAEVRRQGRRGRRISPRASTPCTSTRSKASRAAPVSCRRRVAARIWPTSRS